MSACFNSRMTDVDAPSLFRPLLPDTVRLAEMPPDRADPAALPVDELRQIERAVPKRRLEFAAGRQLARRLLIEIGHDVDAMPSDADRVPRWPQAVAIFSHQWASQLWRAMCRSP